MEKLSLEVLIEFLQDAVESASEPLLVHLEAGCVIEELGFTQVRLLSPHMDLPNRDILWLGEASTILALDAERRAGLCAVVAGCRQEYERLSALNDCSLICLPAETDGAVVFNAVLGYWNRLRQWELEMDVAIAQRACLQRIIDLAEPIIGNPILAWDPSFSVLAAPASPMPEFPVIQQIIDGGHIPGALVKDCIKRGIIKNTYTHFTTFYPPNWAGVPFAIRNYGKEMGETTRFTVVSYFVWRKKTAGAMELLKLLDKKLSAYVINVYGKELDPHIRTYIYEPFFVDLISGQLAAEADIQERLKYIDWEYSRPYCVHLIQFDRFSYRVGGHTRARCKRIFPISKSTVYNDMVYVLHPLKGTEEAISETAQRNFLDLLDYVDGYCGVSIVIQNLSQVRTAANQAEAAVRIGRQLDSSRRIWYYQDTFFQDMVINYRNLSATGDGTQILFPTLKNVIESDERTNNDNLKLLEYHLNNDRSITKTAKQMHLHRNSVIYRLQRIEQMLGASLEDPDVRFNLLVSFRVLKTLHLKEPDHKTL